MVSLSNKKPLRTDVLIIGNGALGLFLADELARRQCGKEIAVVSPASRDGGASQAAGAMLGCFSEVTSDTLRTEVGRARFEIGVDAHDYWENVLTRLQKSAGESQLKVADDTYVILNSSGSDLDSINFSKIIEALDVYKKPWSEADPDSITGLNPKPNCRAFRAIHLPSEGAVDARAVLAALETSIQKMNVSVVDQTVKKIRSKGGSVCGVELGDGSIIEAEFVVVAAGARSEELIRGASDGLDIVPTFPGLGLGLISKRTIGEGFKSVVRTPNRGFACGLHVVPSSDGREYLGATNRLMPQVTNGACFEDLSYFTRCAMEQLDEDIANHEIQQLLRGNRPVTLDGFPLIGSLPLSGLFLMTGTYRDGFHCAPLIASQMADEIQKLPSTLNPVFEPVRKPIESRTIQQSVDEFVEHSLAMWYESSADAPFSTRKLTNQYRDQAMKQYDKLGIDYALSPDVLWYSIRTPVGARRISRYFDEMSTAQNSPLTNIVNAKKKNREKAVT